MENKVQIDPVNEAFAKATEIFTYLGIAVMIVFGLLYLVGLPGFVDMRQAVAHWQLSVDEFWRQIKGTPLYGYSWFLSHLNKMDCLSMIGIAILSFVPVFGFLAAIPKSRSKAYTIFFLILVAGFVFAVIQPIVMPK